MDFLIIYEHDHANRANSLAGALWKATNCKLVSDPAVKVSDVATLAFWGHGTPGFLCGLTPSQLVEKIKEWRAINTKIKTIEIITCNARHNHNANADPYVAKFKAKLGFILRRQLTIKAMPIRMGKEGIHGDSILFADYVSKTWCYLTTRNERSLTFMRNVFKAVCEKDFGDDAIKAATYLTTPPPLPKRTLGWQKAAVAKNPFSKWAESIEKIHDSDTIFGYSHQERFMDDFRNALKDDAFRREFVSTRKYSMNYGDFNALRKSLVNV